MRLPDPARRGGALALLVACFVFSAALRVAGLGAALAEDGVPGAAPDAARGCGPEGAALLEAVRERGAELDARERGIAERQALLDIAEAEIAEQRNALLEAESQLAATMALADSAAERDLAQLTAIYENVKPKRAAGIFDSMDATFAAGILGRMSPATAGEIMTLMQTDKAYAVSVLLAARNMNAGSAPARP